MSQIEGSAEIHRKNTKLGGYHFDRSKKFGKKISYKISEKIAMAFGKNVDYNFPNIHLLEDGDKRIIKTLIFTPSLFGSFLGCIFTSFSHSVFIPILR